MVANTQQRRLALCLILTCFNTFIMAMTLTRQFGDGSKSLDNHIVGDVTESNLSTHHPQERHLEYIQDTDCKDEDRLCELWVAFLPNFCDDDTYANYRCEKTCDHGHCAGTVQEVDFTNSTNNGGMAKASDSLHSSYSPSNAFEGLGFWHSGAPYTLPKSLWYEFPEPIRVVEYSFTGRPHWFDNLTGTDGPSKYIFWASNDDDCTEESEWVILHEDNSGTSFTQDNEPKVEELDNEEYYRCYGFKVTDVPGRPGDPHKYVAIGNVHFYLMEGGHAITHDVKPNDKHTVQVGIEVKQILGELFNAFQEADIGQVHEDNSTGQTDHSEK